MTYAFSHAFEDLPLGDDVYDGEAWVASDEEGEWAVHSFVFLGGGEMRSCHRAFNAFADAFEKHCGEEVQDHVDVVFGRRENWTDEHRLSARQLGVGRWH